MIKCPACNAENDEYNMPCKQCGLYLRYSRFNFFTFPYNYFSTLLPNKGRLPPFSKIIINSFLWILICGILGLGIVPVLMFLNKIMGPTASYRKGDLPPPWVIIVAGIGVVFAIIIFVIPPIREWMDRRDRRKK